MTTLRVPNELFRMARQRKALSRQRLAEEVNAVVGASADQLMGAAAVARIEQGYVRWPREARRRALRQILDAANDAELGFYDARLAGPVLSQQPLEDLGQSLRRHGWGAER